MNHHDHPHAPGPAAHTHAASVPAAPANVGRSLLMSSAWQRVGGALALAACLWLAVAWALHG